MDVKSGATVGFVTALGLTAGSATGYLISEMTEMKRPGVLVALLGVAGALGGAFFAGTLVAGDAPAPTTTTPTPILTTPTPTTGAGMARSRLLLNA